MKEGFRFHEPDPAGQPSILVVCDENDLSRDLARPDWLHFVTFSELSAQALADSRAELVLSPLLGHRFDAMDVADRLSALGFAGRYRALSGCLPSPESIVSEILAACPRLDFRIVILTGSPDIAQIVEFGDQD